MVDALMIPGSGRSVPLCWPVQTLAGVHRYGPDLVDIHLCLCPQAWPWRVSWWLELSGDPVSLLGQSCCGMVAVIPVGLKRGLFCFCAVSGSTVQKKTSTPLVGQVGRGLSEDIDVDVDGCGHRQGVASVRLLVSIPARRWGVFDDGDWEL